MRWPAAWTVAVVAVAACGGDRAPARGGAEAAPPAFEEPVLTNPDLPIRYPVDLYEARREGTVILRLYVDEDGRVVPDSVRIAEGSGIASLDSAALAAVPSMRFAPARREGRPVGVAFLQPVQFRAPEDTVPEGGS